MPCDEKKQHKYKYSLYKLQMPPTAIFSQKAIIQDLRDLRVHIHTNVCTDICKFIPPNKQKCMDIRKLAMLYSHVVCQTATHDMWWYLSARLCEKHSPGTNPVSANINNYKLFCLFYVKYLVIPKQAILYM